MLISRSTILVIVWLLIELLAEAFVFQSPIIRQKAFVAQASLSSSHSLHAHGLHASQLLMKTVPRFDFSKVYRVDVRELRMSTDEAAINAVAAPSPNTHVLNTLINEFKSPRNGNVTATVEEYLYLCDHTLLAYLRGEISSAGEESETVRYGMVTWSSQAQGPPLASQM